MTSNQETASGIDVIRRLHHPNCFVCAHGEPTGLSVKYTVTPEGGVRAVVACPDSWEGYAGVVHGGVIASLLDGAMTNCLFARDIIAVTADLRIRFRHPLHLGRPAVVEAEVTRVSGSLYVLNGRVTQDEELRATGEGRFMRCAADKPAPTL